MTDDGTDPWTAFRVASRLDRAGLASFGQRVDAYVPEARPRWFTMPEQRRLARPDDRLARTIASRRSERSFAVTPDGWVPIGWSHLGHLLSGIATIDGKTRRSYPSAGGLYPLEVFVVVTAVDECRAGVYVHNPDDHSLSPLADLPPGIAAGDLFAGTETLAPITIVVTFDERELVEKYGQRGARFALVEAGHAAQNLSLRATVGGLAGYELGGTVDDALEELLRLPAGRHVALALAFGMPADRGDGRRRRRLPPLGVSRRRRRG